MQRPKISGAAFMRAASGHTGMETSCSGCHLKNLPAGTVGTGAIFDHSNSTYGGQNDCIQCHSGSNVTLTWVGGQFSHSPKPNSCANCHEGERPTYITASGFNHTTSGQGECLTCHSSVTGYNSLLDWKGSTVDHTSVTTCASCHSANMPATIMHTNATYTQNRDCNACHGNHSGTWIIDANNTKVVNPTYLTANSKSWSAVYDHRGLSQNSSCSSCHNSSYSPGNKHPNAIDSNKNSNTCKACH